jgi:hypothetical protein
MTNIVSSAIARSAVRYQTELTPHTAFIKDLRLNITDSKAMAKPREISIVLLLDRCSPFRSGGLELLVCATFIPLVSPRPIKCYVSFERGHDTGDSR